MSTTVCKFGGSSVSDAGMFVRVNRILQADPARKYIVLSAPGKRSPNDEKITDLLYRAHEAGCPGDHSIFAQIFQRYAAIRDALAPNFPLEMEFARIRRDLHTSTDYAASRGEYLCAKLFAAYTGLPFVDAAELLFFNETGEIVLDATTNAVQKKLLPLGRAVVPGFYGTGPDGRIRTFTRGGSDVSGALLAAALHADLYENWTDVDGLYTADPRIVEHPQRNLRVPLQQMEQIATAGANLLHPNALRPLHGKGIDTLLKNTFAPGAEGTRISEGCTENVRCVTGMRQMHIMGDLSVADANVLLHPLPLPGSLPVAVVSAFGLDSVQIRQIERTLQPIHTIHMPQQLQIIVAPQEYEATIRAVHEMLMKA